MPEQTLPELVRESHNAVLALTELIEREYPKREEVNEKFATKKASQTRFWRGMVVLAVMLPVAMIVSIFVTISTVSVCFLGSGASQGTPPAICNVLPGFSDSVKRNNGLIKQFVQLQRITRRNSQRIDRLEKKVENQQ